MGFLVFTGNEWLIALDCQHRLLSLRIAVKGLMGLDDILANAPWFNILIISGTNEK